METQVSDSGPHVKAINEALQQPFQSACHTISGNTAAMTKSLAPFAQRLSGANFECMSFLSRRARAYLDIPRRAAACRTPQDVVNAQLAFWQEAARQYSEAATRVMTVMGPPAGQHAGATDIGANKFAGALAENPWAFWLRAWSGAASQQKPARDYLSLQEQKAEQSTATMNDKPPAGRKAA